MIAAPACRPRLPCQLFNQIKVTGERARAVAAMASRRAISLDQPVAARASKRGAWEVR